MYKALRSIQLLLYLKSLGNYYWCSARVLRLQMLNLLPEQHKLG